jgi:hypothetical protein
MNPDSNSSLSEDDEEFTTLEDFSLELYCILKEYIIINNLPFGDMFNLEEFKKYLNSKLY